MANSLAKWAVVVPLVATSSLAVASEPFATLESPFGFSQTDLEAIQYSRANDNIDISNFGSDSRVYDGRAPILPTRQTEFSFKLKPKRPDFSREGAYGLDLFRDPTLAVESRLSGPSRVNEVIPALNDGFQYSAGLKIEHEDAEIDGTAYVSSSLLGLSYGRMGRLWYGGIDVNLEQFVEDQYGGSQPDVLSLDFTTGRRLGITGLSSDSPLWLLSVQGNFFEPADETGSESEDRSDWYLNPSLFWQKPDFTFSAQMQVPVQFENVNDEGEPDYRLRAVFEKQFK